MYASFELLNLILSGVLQTQCWSSTCLLSSGGRVGGSDERAKQNARRHHPKEKSFQSSNVEEARLQMIKKGGFVDYQANLEAITEQNLFYWPLNALQNLWLKQHKTRKKTEDKKGFILAIKALDQNQKDDKCRVAHEPSAAIYSGNEGCTGRVGRN